MNRYESYENTGLDWVPEIPKHWSVTRSKFIFRNKSVKNCPDEPLLSVTQKDGVVLRSESDLNVWNPTEDVSGYKLIEPSNFVISLRSFEGGLELSTIKGIVSPAYTVLEKTKKINDPYFRWLMKSHQFIIELNKHVTGIRQGKNIGWDDFSNIYLTVPPVEEQKLISRYLDKKTSQIDSLVEKIQKKIELLKEQRTSLINHYVTKGLDPDVEMKDSGVEWIGEIPKHWKISKLKYLCPNGVQYGLNIDSDSYRENGVRFVRITDITSDGRLKKTDGVYLSPNDVPDEYYVRINDILFSRSGGTVGKSIRIEDVDSDTSFAGYLVRFSFEDRDLSKFVKLVTESGFFWKWIDIQIIQSTIQNVNGEKYSNFSFPLPPKVEQKSIVHSVQDKLKIIVKNISNNELKIQLLLEYRQSLISSVVTGKVRVTEDMI